MLAGGRAGTRARKSPCLQHRGHPTQGPESGIHGAAQGHDSWPGPEAHQQDRPLPETPPHPASSLHHQTWRLPLASSQLSHKTADALEGQGV